MEHDGVDELPYYCSDTEYSNEEKTNVEHGDGVDELCEMPYYDEINELPYFHCSDDDVQDFYQLSHSKEETDGIEQDEIENDGIDRISDLPDHVLCRILSFLPTRYAMAAKILSTRWGTLFPFFWISPIVIDLDEADKLPVPRVRAGTRGTKTKTKTKTNIDPRKRFEMFADQLLLTTLANVRCLDVLNMKCFPWREDQKTLSWVTAALRLNVRELYFHLYLRNEGDLFPVLNGYKGLEKLEIFGGSSISGIDLPEEFTLPNLTTLVLSDLSFHSRYACSLPNLRSLLFSKVDMDSSQLESLSELITSCIALEVLSFKSCLLDRSYGGSTSFCFSIQSPSLKNLTIEDCRGIWDCSLTIDAPKLQVLLCKGFAARSYTVSNPFYSLISAHIDVEFCYLADGVEEFVAACSSAIDLYICAFVMEALHCTCAQLPMFNNLNRLALGFIKLEGWEMLAGLLCSSPNIEKLLFKQQFCLHDGGYSKFESLMTSSTPCLELRIKEIEFFVFDEQEDEIKLVEYLMNNGKVIEILKLHSLPFKYESTQERLAMLPRQSKLVFQPR